MRVECAVNLCIGFPTCAKHGHTDESRRHVLAALQAGQALLPREAVLQRIHWTATHCQGVYKRPSHAVTLIRVLQDAFPEIIFRAGIALGCFYDDLIHIEGEAIPPPGIVAAQDALERGIHHLGAWVIYEDTSDDDLYTTAFALTCNVSAYQKHATHKAARAYRRHYSVDEVRTEFGYRRGDNKPSRLVCWSHAREVDRLETLLIQRLDLEVAKRNQVTRDA